MSDENKAEATNIKVDIQNIAEKVKKEITSSTFKNRVIIVLAVLLALALAFGITFRIKYSNLNKLIADAGNSELVDLVAHQKETIEKQLKDLEAAKIATKEAAAQAEDAQAKVDKAFNISQEMQKDIEAFDKVAKALPSDVSGMIDRQRLTLSLISQLQIRMKDIEKGMK